MAREHRHRAGGEHALPEDRQRPGASLLRDGRRLDARGDPRRPAADQGGDTGQVRAADGEPGKAGRGGFQEGLLPRPGDRRARPASGRGQAAHDAPAAAPGDQRQARRRIQRRRDRGQRRGRSPRGDAGLNYYIYYKISPGQLEALRPRVQDLFRKAKLDFGVQARWMRRRDDPATYMEVYEGVKDEAAFEALLEREGAKLGMQRKVERFISAETPA